MKVVILAGCRGRRLSEETELKIGAILHRPELVRFGDLPYRPADPMFVCADVRRLRGATDWKLRYDLDNGLRHTVYRWQDQIKKG